MWDVCGRSFHSRSPSGSGSDYMYRPREQKWEETGSKILPTSNNFAIISNELCHVINLGYVSAKNQLNSVKSRVTSTSGMTPTQKCSRTTPFPSLVLKPLLWPHFLINFNETNAKSRGKRLSFRNGAYFYCELNMKQVRDKSITSNFFLKSYLFFERVPNSAKNIMSLVRALLSLLLKQS